MYSEYSNDQFKGLTVDKELEPELYKFVEYVKENGARFYMHTAEQIDHFAKKIYELSKNNSNNSA